MNKHFLGSNLRWSVVTYDCADAIIDLAKPITKIIATNFQCPAVNKVDASASDVNDPVSGYARTWIDAENANCLDGCVAPRRLTEMG